MSIGASFLGGAKSRLLPPSIPFRFFTAAGVFHVFMWLGLLVAADSAVHLLALGVLVTTAIGASVQLLPVATRRTLHAVWPVKLIFWLTIPGMIGLIVGMYTAWIDVLILAAVIVGAGLLLFGVLLADNLRRASSLPAVGAYGWSALAALVLVALLGITLAVNEQAGILSDHGAVALAHLVLGGFGFMGLLVLGFSHILVPMFAMASAPPKGPSFAGFVIALVALVLGTIGALASNREILAAATVVGLLAAAAHLWLMYRVLKSGMRKRLGLSFVLVRASWIMLPMTLLTGLATLYGLAGANGATLFGFMLLFGWLLTFLFAILQRIMPFLASMFVTPPARGGTAIVAELSDALALKVHAICHALALLMLAIAIVLDDAAIVRLGSAVGLIGALAFAWFTADVIRRLLSAKES
jgi:hypothetical protein